MEYSNNQEILGVSKYALYGQEDRVEELNKRIGSRNNIEKKLEPNFLICDQLQLNMIIFLF